MRVFYIISWSLFFIGVVFQFLHIPGGGIFPLLSCILLLIHNIIFLCKHVKTDFVKVLLYFSYTVLTIYVFGRLLYWGWANAIFPIALLFVIFTLIMYLIKEKPFKIPQIVLVVYFTFFLVFSYTPSYKIYYIVHLNTVLHKERRIFDYVSWDKYSWFLHLRGLKNEALEANKEAYQALKYCAKDAGYLRFPNEEYIQEYFKIIKKHESLIEAGNTNWDEWEAEWERY